LSKTNALRLLDQLGIRYEVRQYEVDPDDLAAETVAAKVGLPPEQVFKTLVAVGDRNGPCLAVIPGSSTLDLKALAQATGDRKVETAPLRDVQSLTGYVRGAVTVFCCRKAYPVYVDETVWLWDVISVSAGMRGMQALLSPEDYIRATGATVVAIARDK
jgi:Cys-tRNA(Pro)/Cys-tRNA(Cys) deacylase